MSKSSIKNSNPIKKKKQSRFSATQLGALIIAVLMVGSTVAIGVVYFQNPSDTNDFIIADNPSLSDKPSSFTYSAKDVSVQVVRLLPSFQIRGLTKMGNAYDIALVLQELDSVSAVTSAYFEGSSDDGALIFNGVVSLARDFSVNEFYADLSDSDALYSIELQRFVKVSIPDSLEVSAELLDLNSVVSISESQTLLVPFDVIENQTLKAGVSVVLSQELAIPSSVSVTLNDLNNVSLEQELEVLSLDSLIYFSGSADIGDNTSNESISSILKEIDVISDVNVYVYPLENSVEAKISFVNHQQVVEDLNSSSMSAVSDFIIYLETLQGVDSVDVVDLNDTVITFKFVISDSVSSIDSVFDSIESALDSSELISSFVLVPAVAFISGELEFSSDIVSVKDKISSALFSLGNNPSVVFNTSGTVLLESFSFDDSFFDVNRSIRSLLPLDAVIGNKALLDVSFSYSGNYLTAVYAAPKGLLV